MADPCVKVIAADVEPQVAGEGEEPLHGLPVELGGMQPRPTGIVRAASAGTHKKTTDTTA